MGTNFYQGGAHVGKRSAAGWYCWDCKVTLTIGGEGEVHMGRTGTHNACPECGKQKPTKMELAVSSAGRELGFNNDEPGPKTGVATCSSFTWAMPLHEFREEEPVEDEYERVYPNLKAVLTECPIRFYDSIGVDFS